MIIWVFETNYIKYHNTFSVNATGINYIPIQFLKKKDTGTDNAK